MLLSNSEASLEVGGFMHTGSRKVRDFHNVD